MDEPDCFRKLQDATLSDEEYVPKNPMRTKALGIRGRRSTDFTEPEEILDSFPLPSVSDYVWANLGFLFFGLFIGVSLGAIGHMFYILHGNIPRSHYNRVNRNYNFSSDH